MLRAWYTLELSAERDREVAQADALVKAGTQVKAAALSDLVEARGAVSHVEQVALEVCP